MLRVGGQHGFASDHNFVEHVATDANLSHFTGAIPEARHCDSQIFAPFVTHHDQAAISRYRLKHQRHDLFQRFVKRG
jgi:hypothetical protein